MNKDTDFDLLSAGASPEEARRLRKILTEWTQGDENGFPVQFALLTRAQWRSAAAVPRLIDDARKQFAADATKGRQELLQLTQTCCADLAKITGNLQESIKRNSVDTALALEKLDQCLDDAGVVCRAIQSSLEEGKGAWDRAKVDFETRRKEFETTLKELRKDEQSWGLITSGLLILLAVSLAFACGWHVGKTPGNSPVGGAVIGQ
jgi:hypothetical protein